MDASILAIRGELVSLATNTNMERFLSTVERRAFLMARAALGNQEDALDAVQDAMMQLVKRYRHKPEDEWRLLFFTILSNRLRDIIRRRTVRGRFTGWLATFSRDGEEAGDPFQEAPDSPANNPALEAERHQSMEALAQAVETLPRRQQEAFMLRCWEGLSTAETAGVMKCSEGSVKTHYSRALQVLQEKLRDHHDDY